MPRPTVPAHLRPRENGYVDVYCGHVCPAKIGVLWPPSAPGRGPRYPDLAVALRDTNDEPSPSTRWSLHAPENRRVAAADGFSRRREDGVLIYSIIRPKPKRDVLGRTVLDATGQPVPRRGGWSPSPPDWAGADAFNREAEHHVYGHQAAVPAVIECWRCRRLCCCPDPAAEPC